MDGTRPFTAAGLGDRIHHCTVAWCYGPPVTLHLAEQHVTGGQFANKAESWREVIALFPPGAITVVVDGARGRVFRYGDAPMLTDTPEALDATPLLRCIPRLAAVPQDVALPKRFVTVQWDANGRSRTAPPERRAAILADYGCEAVVVGGEADDPLRWSLPHIAYAMSRAEAHVGADSAFMHLAQLYLPPQRIHIWTQGWTHHTRRLKANGGRVTMC